MSSISCYIRIAFLFLILASGVSCLVTSEILVVSPLSLNESGRIFSSVVDADFSAAPTSGRIPLMVQFIDLSKGNPVSWDWDFGDHSYSSKENPVHTYTRGGIYSVQLTVYGARGDTDTVAKTGYITARPLPLVADFSAEPKSGTAPLTVQFTDLSTGAMVWLWNFGDGSTERMIPNPSHTFMEPGTYQVRLKVSNELGETAVHWEYIDVYSRDEISADFSGSPRSGPAPLSVQFTDNSTGDISSWSWQFGDGTKGAGKNPLHVYEVNGNYSVTLTVSSSDQRSDTKQKDDYIRVTETPVPGTIPFSAGWNFLSVPYMLLSGKDTAAIFQYVDTDGHSAFRYNPEMGGWIALSSSDPVRPLEGYWVYSAKKDEILVSFNPDFEKIPPRMLYNGWNTAGFAGMNPVEVKQGLSSVNDYWMYCVDFNSEMQQYNEVIIKGVNDNEYGYPYHGYWVYMNGDGILLP